MPYRKALKGADSLLLATDPDREGEAISWHLLAALGLDKKPAIKVQRVVFHEITKDAIIHAVQHPRDIATDLVDAQQARSILDYLVGFNLSPFLWKRSVTDYLPDGCSLWLCGLSVSGRRRSPPLWSRSTGPFRRTLKKRGGRGLKAGLFAVDGKKLEKFDIPDISSAEALKAAISKGEATVAAVTRKEMKRNPAPPFTTSTLQQEASRKLGFSAKKPCPRPRSCTKGWISAKGGRLV